MTLIASEQLRERIDALDAVRVLRSASAGERLFLVGGAVRDLLLGAAAPGDLDVAVDGDVEALAARLGVADATHERFGTASVQVGMTRVDLARTRTESYSQPGALPDVAPARIEEDLARRDFTINAIAVPLDGSHAIIDPHSGTTDLGAGLIRVLHGDSFRDDPTRALRAARYCARLGFKLEPETGKLMAAADLEGVSADRRDQELLRIAEEPAAAAGFALLAEWGLASVDAGAAQRVQASLDVLAESEWAGVAERAQVALAAAIPDPALEAGILRLASARPALPSEAVSLIRGRSGVELVLARAAGGAWLDRVMAEWGAVRLEISGSDLIAAGVPEGPAIGRALDAALVAKLDGRASGHDQELAVALRAAAS
ncbi:MAG: hypothetical protein M3383_06805 [Actinomycetota bacterium]|nr:hypothetical protein [Actinomycetota bacterium]